MDIVIRKAFFCSLQNGFFFEVLKRRIVFKDTTAYTTTCASDLTVNNFDRKTCLFNTSYASILEMDWIVSIL